MKILTQLNDCHSCNDARSIVQKKNEVGSVFTHLKVGKDIRVTKAPPQGQAMNGLAERSVRTLKEQFLTISEELKGEGVSISDTGNAMGQYSLMCASC